MSRIALKGKSPVAKVKTEMRYLREAGSGELGHTVPVKCRWHYSQVRKCMILVRYDTLKVVKEKKVSGATQNDTFELCYGPFEDDPSDRCPRRRGVT